MMKLTPQIKRQITRDWSIQLPGLGIYAPMQLLRRCGPLLIGVCLDRDSGNDGYRPTFHVHSLTKEHRGISLTMCRRLLTLRTGAEDRISVIGHVQRHVEAAQRMTQQVLLPLSGPVTLQMVVDAYQAYLQSPSGRWSVHHLEDIITLLVACGRPNEAKHFLRETATAMASWPAFVVARMEPINSWAEKMQRLIDRPDLVHQTVSEQAARLKVDKLPTTSLDNWVTETEKGQSRRSKNSLN